MVELGVDEFYKFRGEATFERGDFFHYFAFFNGERPSISFPQIKENRESRDAVKSVAFRIGNPENVLNDGPHEGVVDDDKAVGGGGDLVEKGGGGVAEKGGGVEGGLEVGGEFGGGVRVGWRREKMRGLEFVKMYVGIGVWVPPVHTSL